MSYPLDFLALKFCSLTDYQKLSHNCSLYVKVVRNSFPFSISAELYERLTRL